MRLALLLSGSVTWPLTLARTWLQDGDDVTVVLLDRAAAAARVGHHDGAAVAALVEAGAAVLAEQTALQRRGITADDAAAGVKPVDLDVVADLIADGADRVIWL